MHILKRYAIKISEVGTKEHKTILLHIMLYINIYKLIFSPA